jgi:HK97 family phage major capsid protein
MEFPNEKRQRAGHLISECRAILDMAAADKRELTENEQVEWDKKMNEAEDLNRGLGGTFLTRAEALEGAEKYLSRSQGTIAGGKQDSKDYGHDPADWRNKEGTVTRALSHSESVRGYLESRDYDHDFAKLHPGAILRALALGTTNEVERRALAVGIDTAGGYTVPDILAGGFIDAMRAASVVSRAGARTVPLEGQTSIAKVVSDPVPQWRGENQPVEESEPTFGSVTFRPKSLAVLARASREVLEDSVNIEEVLMQTLGAAMGKELDRVCMIGTGAANEPAGIVNWPGVQTFAHNGTPDYDALLTARTMLLTVDSRPPTAVLLHPRDEGVYSKLKDTQGLPSPRPPALQDVNFLTTTQIPITLGAGSDSLIITGDFKRALIGVRTQLRIEVLKERYADQLQYGFLAWMRADLVLEHGKAFAVITGVQAA